MENSGSPGINNNNSKGNDNDNGDNAFPSVKTSEINVLPQPPPLASLGPGLEELTAHPPAPVRVGQDWAPAGTRVVLRGWGAEVARVAVRAVFVSFLNELWCSLLAMRFRNNSADPDLAV